MEKREGFTLVELIVVLVILSILAAISVPSFVKYIDKARKAGVLLECRLCVTAAQTLQIENYGMGTGDPTVEEIATLADVPGEIDPMEIKDEVLYHLSYTRDSYTCTYCREYEECTNHNERYNFSDGEDSPGGGETKPEKPEKPSLPGLVDIGPDTDKMYVQYDFATVVKGENLVGSTVFYWQGEYYYVRDTITYEGEDKVAFISGLMSGEGVYSNKITKFVNPDKFVSDGEKPSRGSLKDDIDGVRIYIPDYDNPKEPWHWKLLPTKHKEY